MTNFCLFIIKCFNTQKRMNNNIEYVEFYSMLNRIWGSPPSLKKLTSTSIVVVPCVPLPNAFLSKHPPEGTLILNLEVIILEHIFILLYKCKSP